jgi:CheY-like chemotaxis protein
MARILVIDDTKNIQKMVVLTLTQVGHDVHVADDGAQGLERFGDGSAWNVTLIDQRMPEVEGIDVVREARRRDPGARLIMMTAFASNEIAAEVLRLGAIDFLRKPFSTATLRGAVETAMKTEKAALSRGGEAQLLVTGQAELPQPRFPQPQLPRPGHSGFEIPRLSYRINGYSFWPVKPVPELQTPEGMEFGRFFQVRSPDGDFNLTFAGITPRIREQFQKDLGREVAENDLLWDKVCGQALLNFIWGTTTTPPDVLPVYELPADLRHNRAVQWK